MILPVRPGTNALGFHEIVQAWYRDELRKAAMPLVARWETRLGVQVERCFVQLMKTKWGGYNPVRDSNRLNTELAKKSRECLEYILFHEMVHRLEPTHNTRFVVLMDRFMPKWVHYRQALNRLPHAKRSWSANTSCRLSPNGWGTRPG